MNISKKIKLLENLHVSFGNRLKNCDLCPRECQVDRLAGEKGFCGTGASCTVYTSFLHHGEEPPISGKNGSGTIFFSGCSLRCIYCQNFTFSHTIAGEPLDIRELANIMLNLQNNGAHNINLVTPTHFLAPIIKSLSIACTEGLHIPLLYNTSGYEKREIIKSLQGIVDIYLTDIKYFSSTIADNCSKAPDYPETCRKAVLEMAKQVPIEYNDGILTRGLVIRHLVLPNHTDESKNILSWIKDTVPDALVSVMFQYRPYHKAHYFPLIDRPVSYNEYLNVKEHVETLDIKGWVQDFDPPQELAGVHFKPGIEK